MQKRSRIILLKIRWLSSKEIVVRLSCSEPKINRWVNCYLTEGVDGLRNKPGQGAKPHHGFIGRRSRKSSHRKGQAQCNEGQGEMGAGNRQGGVPRHVQGFFISLGARFGRIRKTAKWISSPQLCAYKKEKLQELEQQYREGLIDLYFRDGSFTCSEGYVPYGRQFPGENITIPSHRGARLNIRGMIDYDIRYHGFCSTESMTSEHIADFPDRFSLTIRKNTFIVLDNAKVHRSKYMKERRKIWEKRGLYLFFLPPYSPHLNIAETLWRMLKGHWIQPADYISTDNLFYAVNRALAGLGKTHFINFSKRA
ncbi:MAG: IS630 family transposase [Muribaculaceae bacterium]|nr:IS630 family transposase [Muribaculaceae bacterium]